MRKKLIDKISFALLITLVLAIGFTIVEWARNAFQTHKHWVYSVDVNNDNIIASASENEILLWRNEYCIDSLIGHEDAIKSVSFSHDGHFIVSGSIDKSIKVWSMADKKEIGTLQGHTAGVNAVMFSVSDKYIISAGYDSKLFIWDRINHQRIKEFDVKHTEFSISKSDMLAFVDTACNLKLYDLTSLSLIKIVGQYCGEPKFHPDGKILALKTEGGNIQFIDGSSGDLQSVLDTKHGTHYGPFAFTPDGNFIVTGIWGGDIEIWDWKRNELVETLHGTPLNSIDDFAFNKENQLLSASGDCSVKTWDLKTGRLKSNIGDGLYRKQLVGISAFLCLITLISGFLGIFRSVENKYSSLAVMSILTVWSFGILLLGLFVKSYLTKYSTPIIWVLTIISGLAVWSLYGALLAVFIIPVSLSLGYLSIRVNRENISKAAAPIALNLILCGILVSFIVSAGLLR